MKLEERQNTDYQYSVVIDKDPGDSETIAYAIWLDVGELNTVSGKRIISANAGMHPSQTVELEDYKDGVTIKAGEYLNGYDLSAWAGQKLVIDEKHITYASGADYDDITAGTTLLKPKTDGTLEVASTAPSSGVYFKVTDKVTLTEKAVKAVVMVA